MIGKLRHLPDANKKADALLERFDLLEAADRRVATYSGGMRRRLDLSMSLLGTPSVVFLDEPTTGLDPQSRITMWKIIEDLAHSRITVFLTTQYLDEADQLADQISILNKGKIVAEGTAAELYMGHAIVFSIYHFRICICFCRDIVSISNNISAI